MYLLFKSDGHVMPLSIFPHNLRLSTEACLKCLKEVVLTWIERMAAGRPKVWQQNSALCHTSRRTQCWQGKNFRDHLTLNIWLPN